MAHAFGEQEEAGMKTETCGQCRGRKLDHLGDLSLWCCGCRGKGHVVVDYLPADLDLRGLLGDTMGRAKIETAALYLVDALAQRGNAWRAIHLAMVADNLRRALSDKREPFLFIAHNIFLSPDFDALAAGGFAVFNKAPPTLEFTELGIRSMAKWVKLELTCEPAPPLPLGHLA